MIYLAKNKLQSIADYLAENCETIEYDQNAYLPHKGCGCLASHMYDGWKEELEEVNAVNGDIAQTRGNWLEYSYDLLCNYDGIGRDWIDESNECHDIQRFLFGMTSGVACTYKRFGLDVPDYDAIRHNPLLAVQRIDYVLIKYSDATEIEPYEK